jgi:uncharacterized repeat protein (TIGR03803 family)
MIHLRYALGAVVIVAALAGCGEGSTTLSPSPAGVTAERTRPNVTEEVLWSFKGYPHDGAHPEVSLVNVHGTLYGTTFEGGEKKSGTVFAVTPSGTETVLYSFKGSGDGSYPSASLLNVKGTLYGTTRNGGSSACLLGTFFHGCGTVFAVSLSGEETVLHSFGGKPDGAFPVAGLINVNGTLYGTTESGGADGHGTVFAITTSGAETVLHSFGGQAGDGASPHAGLINVKGTLYGTTESGGADGYGTVFAITTNGAETVLHSFGGKPDDGAYPVAGLLNVKGTLYGTTEKGGAHCRPTRGCGTVFAVTTSGKETVLYSFKGSGDGRNPIGGLISVDGMLYGTTRRGPNRRGGTVFAITASGKKTVLHSFGGLGDGSNPDASLLDITGTLYGVTNKGGANYVGTVFSLSL